MLWNTDLVSLSVPWGALNLPDGRVDEWLEHRAKDDERKEKRAVREVTSRRKICDCEHQSSEENDSSLDYWTRCLRHQTGLAAAQAWRGAVVVQRSDYSPPTQANRVLLPVRSLLGFLMWESCRTMALCDSTASAPKKNTPSMTKQLIQLRNGTENNVHLGESKQIFSYVELGHSRDLSTQRACRLSSRTGGNLSPDHGVDKYAELKRTSTNPSRPVSDDHFIGIFLSGKLNENCAPVHRARENTEAKQLPTPRTSAAYGAAVIEWRHMSWNMYQAMTCALSVPRICVATSGDKFVNPRWPRLIPLRRFSTITRARKRIKRGYMSDEALGVRVSVARIAPSLLDLDAQLHSPLKYTEMKDRANGQQSYRALNCFSRCVLDPANYVEQFPLEGARTHECTPVREGVVRRHQDNKRQQVVVPVLAKSGRYSASPYHPAGRRFDPHRLASTPQPPYLTRDIAGVLGSHDRRDVLAEKQFNVRVRRLVVQSQRDWSTSSLVCEQKRGRKRPWLRPLEWIVLGSFKLEAFRSDWLASLNPALGLVDNEARVNKSQSVRKISLSQTSPFEEVGSVAGRSPIVGEVESDTPLSAFEIKWDLRLRCVVMKPLLRSRIRRTGYLTRDDVLVERLPMTLSQRTITLSFHSLSSRAMTPPANYSNAFSSISDVQWPTSSRQALILHGVNRPPVAQSVGAPPIWGTGGSGFESRVRGKHTPDVSPSARHVSSLDTRSVDTIAAASCCTRGCASHLHARRHVGHSVCQILLRLYETEWLACSRASEEDRETLMIVARAMMAAYQVQKAS
ncbi:hypothetical protein PR048_007272 [Dryococelus australis]|uniref:Uncharacterized protein n=1 Tax=Dryococelus australis TaxID=614101 RepID=A0ABQ9IFB7_9NEOP|nr:hypothetical protein PR048_007272 [Dryococelus australis]